MMRERELELLLDRVSEHIEGAERELRLIRDVPNAVRDSNVESAGLAVLERLARAQRDVYEAGRGFALAMDDRGTPTATVARALGVSRGSIINWRRDRDERENAAH